MTAAEMLPGYTYDENSDTINNDGTVTVPVCVHCGARAKHKIGRPGHGCTNPECDSNSARHTAGRYFTTVTLRRFEVPRV